MSETEISHDSIRDVLACYEGFEKFKIEIISGGLINRSYRVERGNGDLFVLQRLNPLFSPLIHHNIAAVTGVLAQAGLLTPQLFHSRSGEPWIDRGSAGIWRLQTLIQGCCFDKLHHHNQAQSAGLLVGRWHRVLHGLSHQFVGLRSRVHDTQQHLEVLQSALDQNHDHRLYDQIATLSDEIFAAANKSSALPTLDPIIGHGDLKISNLIFDQSDPTSAQAIALVDLDTVAPMSLAHELGDAWRSWCNLHAEDDLNAQFDIEIYSRSLSGYLRGWNEPLSQQQCQGLLLGVEWISLELSARFAADALRESYFGWDKQRFPRSGEHNLLRARSQWSLHRQICETQLQRARLLGL